MPKHKRRVVIEECPICKGRHTYQLRLGTTYLFGGGPEEEKNGARYLTLVLRCPVQDAPFKAEVAIPLKSYLWISQVDAEVERHMDT